MYTVAGNAGRLVSWLALQYRSVKNEGSEAGRAVNWLESQYKTVSAIGRGGKKVNLLLVQINVSKLLKYCMPVKSAMPSPVTLIVTASRAVLQVVSSCWALFIHSGKVFTRYFLKLESGIVT